MHKFFVIAVVAIAVVGGVIAISVSLAAQPTYLDCRGCG